jgi:TolB protein
MQISHIDHAGYFVSRIAVVLSDGSAGYVGIYHMPSGRLEKITVDNTGRNSKVFWSPNRRLIAFTDESGIISFIDLAAGNRIKIDQTFLPSFVDWSYDSRKLIYSNGRVIRYYDVRSRTFNTIIRPGASYVQWFPGDNEMLYEARDKNGISQLYRSWPNGGNERQITRNSGYPLNEVRLSPDGRYVLYTSPGASISEIYTLELVSGRLAKIPGGPEAKNYYPVWSPDSKKIAYSSTQFSNGKYNSLIRFSGIKGDGDKTISAAGCYATPVAWSPDGQRIAYLSGCGDNSPATQLWSVGVIRHNSVKLSGGFYFYYLDW